MFRQISAVCLVVLFFGAARAPRVHRDVATSAGVVRGYLTTQGYYAFLGVPYARHTRRDRFKAPRPPRRWDGIFEATHRVKCPQPGGAGVEDCLVVNVFTPKNSHALPVLALVHEGGFQKGWGLTRPPTHLLTNDFVIVTFNYRVSALGFLCLGVPEAPGNVGLKDQVAALYWIHKNIASFGGNPYDVTAYGFEAGAAAVQLLLLTKSTTGLIHKAITESGSALSPLSISYDPLLTAIEVAKSLGYEGTESPGDLAGFYNNLPSKTLVNITNMFLPCIENNLPTTHSLLEKEPLEIIKSQDYQIVPMLIAYTNNPCKLSTVSELEKLPNLSESYAFLPSNLEFDSENTKQRVAKVIRNFYAKQEQIREKLIQSYVDYVNDVSYEYPIVKSAQLFAATNPVYLVKFYISESKRKSGNSTNAPTDILDYFYHIDYKSKIDEIKIAQLATIWKNFIKIGDPTPITSFLIPVIWQPVQQEKSYSEMDIRSVRGLYFDRMLISDYQVADECMVFWDHIYKKFYRAHVVVNNDKVKSITSPTNK